MRPPKELSTEKTIKPFPDGQRLKVTKNRAFRLSNYSGTLI